jgi:hypothetical protein
VIKSLSLQRHLEFWANKDRDVNLVSTEGVEQRSFCFLARNLGREKTVSSCVVMVQMCCHGTEVLLPY